jgi:hypothetical protein
LARFNRGKDLRFYSSTRGRDTNLIHGSAGGRGQRPIGLGMQAGIGRKFLPRCPAASPGAIRGTQFNPHSQFVNNHNRYGKVGSSQTARVAVLQVDVLEPPVLANELRPEGNWR